MREAKITLSNRLLLHIICDSCLNLKLLDELRELVTKKNPKRQQLMRMRVSRAALRDEPEFYIGIEEFKHTDLEYIASFPLGQRSSVVTMLENYGFTPEIIEDHPSEFKYSLANVEHSVTLRNYQQKLFDCMVSTHVSLIRSPPGSGKTTTALRVAAYLGLQTLVIVPRLGLYEQWRERCKIELGLSDREIGSIQGTKRTVRGITIASQQTLVNCVDDFRNSFGLVICDEAQTFAAKTFLEVVDKINSQYRIGITADERRSDGKDFLVRWMFGPPLAEISRDELEDNNVLEDVAIIVVPYEREAPFWWTRATNEQRARPELQYRIMEHIVSDKPRTHLAVELLEAEARQGLESVALSHRVDHCKEMQVLLAQKNIGAGLLIGGSENKREYNMTRDAIRERRTKAAIGTYQAIGVGIDLPILSVGVCATPCANFKKSRFQWNQFRGRFARKAAEKTVAQIYYIWDKHLFGESVLRNLGEWNRTVMVRIDRDNVIPLKQYLEEYEA